MSDKSPRVRRFVGIFALIAVSAGMIFYSACRVRYRVDGKPTSEFVITQLSLTHCVERDSQGNLTNPYAESTSRPVVWAVEYKQDNGLQVTDNPAKKPAPKKPGKKPAPKKPAKPAGKRKPKACPT